MCGKLDGKGDKNLDAMEIDFNTEKEMKGYQT